MADSWVPQQSRLRRLRVQQNSIRLASIDGRVRQAAPVPYRPDIEFPPFNMHVDTTPPEDVYLGRYWMNMSPGSTPSTPIGLMVWTGDSWQKATAT